MPLTQGRWIVENRQGRFVASLPVKDNETLADALRRAALMLNRPATDLRVHRSQE